MWLLLLCVTSSVVVTAMITAMLSDVMCSCMTVVVSNATVTAIYCEY